MFEFTNQNYLWLLILIPVLIAYELFLKNKKQVRISYPRLNLIKDTIKRNSIYEYLPLVIRTLIYVTIILALARPRIANKQEEIIGNGIDIMIALDVSGSMKAVDFKPVNRLESAKKVAKHFIDKRINDRIGIVDFAEHAYTKSPLTLDYNILSQILDKIQISDKANGTAVGMGLATAVARLKDSEAKSKVIILITDGENNSGSIEPIKAAQIAEALGIKVYPIGVGRNGLVDYPVQTPFGMRYQKTKINVDMDTLNKIAQITGTVRASRARNTDELDKIIEIIDKLETSQIEIKNYFTYDELFHFFIALALLFMMIELFFRLSNKYLPNMR